MTQPIRTPTPWKGLPTLLHATVESRNAIQQLVERLHCDAQALREICWEQGLVDEQTGEFGVEFAGQGVRYKGDWAVLEDTSDDVPF